MLLSVKILLTFLTFNIFPNLPIYNPVSHFLQITTLSYYSLKIRKKKKLFFFFKKYLTEAAVRLLSKLVAWQCNRVTARFPEK